MKDTKIGSWGGDPWKQSALVGHDKHMPSMLRVNQSPLFPTGACKICGALCNRRSVLREKVSVAREGQCCERRSVLREKVSAAREGRSKVKVRCCERRTVLREKAIAAREGQCCERRSVLREKASAAREGQCCAPSFAQHYCPFDSLARRPRLVIAMRCVLYDIWEVTT